MTLILFDVFTFNLNWKLMILICFVYLKLTLFFIVQCSLTKLHFGIEITFVGNFTNKERKIHTEQCNKVQKHLIRTGELSTYFIEMIHQVIFAIYQSLNMFFKVEQYKMCTH